MAQSSAVTMTIFVVCLYVRLPVVSVCHPQQLTRAWFPLPLMPVFAEFIEISRKILWNVFFVCVIAHVFARISKAG